MRDSLLSKLGKRRPSALPAVEDARAAVAARVEQAELHDDPFPHLVIEDLLPRDAFAGLAAAIPAEKYFDGSGKRKLDLDIQDEDEHFKASPRETREVWAAARDAIFRETVTPIIARRLADGLRTKYEFLFGPEIAAELLDRGLTSTDGRIQGRRPGYDLKPHLDSAHFGVTCLLYFSSSGASDSGALCLFRPERDPEVRDASTYYPAEQEGIAIEVAKTIPIRENLLVAFLNVRNALHGVKIDPQERASDFVRYAYQCQIVPRGFSITEIYPRLDSELQARWERVVEHKKRIDSM